MQMQHPLQAGAVPGKRTVRRAAQAERLLTYALLVGIALLILYPILQMAASSLKSSEEYINNPLGLPAQVTFANYKEAWVRAKFGQYFFNSLFVTAASVAGITLLGAMAAYGINRMARGKQLLLNYLLLGMMVPAQATIITLFIFLKQLHLLNKYPGLILVYVAHSLPLAILIFSGFFKTIPKELEEAAMIDGSSDMGTFWRIILPLSRPVVATVIILTGLSVWNDFFMPLILLMDPDKYTLAVGLLRLKGEFSIPWPQFFAAMVMIASPMVILFLLLQNQFIKGLTSGSVKG